MLVARVERKSSAFILRREDIDRLLSSLEPYFSAVMVQVNSVDGLTRSFEHHNEFVAFQNSKRSAITELRVSARNEEEHSFDAIFNDDDRSNVRIILSADDRIATTVNEIYEDFVSGIQPWYRRIATADWVGSTLFAFIVLFGGLAIASSIKTGSMPNLDEFRLKHFIIGFPVALIPLALGIYLRKVKRRFFPMGAFAIGDGVRRLENDEVWRTVFIAGFVVSIVSSLALSWFI